MMASLRKVLQSSLPKCIRRSLTVNHALRASGGGMREYHEPPPTAFDESNPAQLTRIEIDETLAAKEQAPWTELSIEDKVALYRSQFVKTMTEENAKPSEGPQLFFGISALIGVGVLFFVFLKKYVGPTPPYTFTPEWRQAQEEKMKLYRMNPITGIGSK